MKNKAHDLSTYTFSNSEPLLLDANIWLFLFPAPSDILPIFVKKYSASFKRMLSAKVELALDAMILSEYLNAYCRIEWKALHLAACPKFKAFRQSSAYVSVGQGAALYARNIIKLCTRHDHPFSVADVTRVLADFESGTCDFNDGLFVECCRQHGWKFVTDDADFTNGGIDVLTSNPKLLRACQ